MADENLTSAVIYEHIKEEKDTINALIRATRKAIKNTDYPPQRERLINFYNVLCEIHSKQ